MEKVEKNIYQIDKNYYRIIIKKNNNTFSEYVNGSITEARRIKKKMLSDISTRNISPNSNIKFREYRHIYYENYAKIELSPTTISKDEGVIKNYLSEDLDGLSLKNSSPFILHKLFNKLKKGKN